MLAVNLLDACYLINPLRTGQLNVLRVVWSTYITKYCSGVYKIQNSKNVGEKGHTENMNGHHLKRSLWGIQTSCVVQLATETTQKPRNVINFFPAFSSFVCRIKKKHFYLNII